MTLPPEREQLARSKCIRHIELEQNPVTQAEPGQGRCELFPTQHRLVRLPQVRGSLQRARRIFRKKILIDRFSEDRLDVCPDLQDSVSRPRLGQLVEVSLKRELVEVFQPHIPELVNEVSLDDVLLYFGSFIAPVRLFERQVAVQYEPSEGDSSIDHGLVTVEWLFTQLGDLAFQLFSGLRFRHLALESEDHLSDSRFGFTGGWIDLHASEVSVPLLSA